MKSEFIPENKVQVFILSYNRPEYIEEAIESLIVQTYKPIELIVSDNSTSEVIKDIVESKFPQIGYRKRSGNLPFSEHMNLVLSEVTTDHFMIFHDDDILFPNAVEKLLSSFSTGCIAVAGNALLLKERQQTKELMNKSLSDKTYINKQSELILNYIGPARNNNPFPAYCFSKDVTSFRLGGSGAGKYSDVVFLIDILNAGKILWLSEPIMHLRIHSRSEIKSHDTQAMYYLNMKFNEYVQTSAVEDHLRFILFRENIRCRDFKGIVTSCLYFIFRPMYLVKYLIRKPFYSVRARFFL